MQSASCCSCCSCRNTVDRLTSMKPPAGLLSLSVCVSLLSSSSLPHLNPAGDPGCFKVNSCKCILKDGSGVINLRGMGDADGFLGRLRAVPVYNTSMDTESLFSFRPCQVFSQPEDLDLAGGACSGVAACLIVRSPGARGHISRYVNYGMHEGNEFHYNHTLKMLTVFYFAHREQPMTAAHYHCSPNQSTSSLRVQSLGSQGPLHIWVESPCACPNACAVGDLGLGTIFLIILSLSAAAYFILGSCALQPFQSSSGMQISPERSVWCMICYFCSETRPTPAPGLKRIRRVSRV
ncbi:uncharacterized protein LOC107836831 [Poecilia formosa]|uniref:uncharacterized protein LOC107836831 n=1 Tax=Poecilia formosa TaxID=48698 RepID=UPI0007B99FF4|nr:PREDICTED: uncharacterized protein LOC107836831 [Poecilia formosa]